MYNLSGKDRGGLELSLLLAITLLTRYWFTTGARRRCLVLFFSLLIGLLI